MTDSEKLEALRSEAHDVIDALVLPGHPIEQAWENLLVLCGRYCDPFRDRWRGHDEEAGQSPPRKWVPETDGRHPQKLRHG